MDGEKEGGRQGEDTTPLVYEMEITCAVCKQPFQREADDGQVNTHFLGLCKQMPPGQMKLSLCGRTCLCCVSLVALSVSGGTSVSSQTVVWVGTVCTQHLGVLLAICR